MTNSRSVSLLTLSFHRCPLGRETIVDSSTDPVKLSPVRLHFPVAILEAENLSDCAVQVPSSRNSYFMGNTVPTERHLPISIVAGEAGCDETSRESEGIVAVAIGCAPQMSKVAKTNRLST